MNVPSDLSLKVQTQMPKAMALLLVLKPPQYPRSTTETMMAGERLIEALETGDADIEARTAARAAGHAEPAFHALIVAEFENASNGRGNFGRSPVDEDMSAKVRFARCRKDSPAQLDDALLVLPFDKVLSLLKYLDYWARKEWNIPLVSRILFFLLRTHHNQIVANRVMRPTLLDLKSHLRQALARQKATIGFNLAALKYIKAQHVAQKTSEIYERQGLDVMRKPSGPRSRLMPLGRGRFVSLKRCSFSLHRNVSPRNSNELLAHTYSSALVSSVCCAS